MKQPFCERLVYKRFSPLEQYGCAAGGTTHVIATLLAGAEIDADSFAPGISDFKRMRQHGVKERLIQQMVKMAVKESRLQVTDDAHLMLIDYDNKEVKMLPIDKVVYIFFLRHPEGVALKELTDHREELNTLYRRVLQCGSLTEKQQRSVDRLCNPMDNSVNEKISRIRLAFNAVVHESIARNYTIQGTRGGKRYIALADELIVWEQWGKV